MTGAVPFDAAAARRFGADLDEASRRILAEPPLAAPSPHLFCPGFATPHVLACLEGELPSRAGFADVEEGGSILRTEDALGYYWGLYDECVRHLLFRLLPAFAEWLPRKQAELRPHGMSLARLRPYPSFVGYANPARGVPPHVDGACAVLNAVSVLGYPGGRPAPVTNFFRAAADHSFAAASDYPPSRGSLFVWLNLEDAWHGVRDRLEPLRLTHTAAIEAVERQP